MHTLVNSGPESQQNIDKWLFWNAISASIIVFGLQFYRYK